MVKVTGMYCEYYHEVINDTNNVLAELQEEGHKILDVKPIDEKSVLIVYEEKEN